MDRDGRDSDDADWLLAQLGDDRPVRQAPPVTPAPTEPPVPTPASPVQPRREESLDWFSLADAPPAPDAAPETDAATQALPVIDAPGANDDAVPPAAASLPPEAPPLPPAAPLSPADPAVPSPPASSSPLTSVEPPVGRAPSANELPPGPVTPPNPFALTWGDDRPLDSEDAVRAAFRNLSQSGEHPVAPDAAAPASEPDRTLPSPASGPEAPGAPSAEAASSPFAGYSAPPVARQTFTPVGGNPIVEPPQPEPPRHPSAPITAPAGWGEQRTPAEPIEPAPVPAPAEPVQAAPLVSPAHDEYDHELWSALVEPEPQATVAPTWAPSAPARPAAPTPPQPAEAGGFSSLDARGDAGSESATVGAPAEGWASGRMPFPAFASADDPARREPKPSEPVDDLLAALGGGASAPSASQPATPEAPPAATSSSPERGATPPPSGGDGGLDALGLDVVGHPADAAAGDAAHTAGAESDDEIGVESPIAREIAETGYFWNLTPDPSAPDPKAEAGPVGLERPSPLAPLAMDGTAEAMPADPTPTALLPSTADAAEPPAAAPTAPMPDTIAALFGGAAATQAASAPAAASAAGSAGAAASPFAASAAATGPAFAATSAAAVRPPTAPTAAPRSAGSGGAGGGSRPTGDGGGNDRRAVRTLLWIAGSLVVLVVLAALFFLGTRLAPTGDAAATRAPDATTASEAPVPEPTAAQPPGVHAWNTLFGGECLEPFPSAWENEYTVVDCAAPHAAQLVFRGELAGDAAAPFPGEEALAAQMADLCRADGIIDPALVAGMNDLQVAASYPVESQWAEGERTFYCFANRSSGEPLTGSIMGPGPAA